MKLYLLLFLICFISACSLDSEKQTEQIKIAPEESNESSKAQDLPKEVKEEIVITSENIVIADDQKVGEASTTIAIDDVFKISAISEVTFNNMLSQYSQLETIDSLDASGSIKDSISFTCSNADRITFRNVYSDYDDEEIRYYYLNTISKINAHLIVESGWEWGNIYLLDYINCDTTKLPGFPVFNPTFTKVACFNSTLGDERIFICDYENDVIKPNFWFETLLNPTDFFIGAENDLYIKFDASWSDNGTYRDSSQCFKFEVMNW